MIIVYNRQLALIYSWTLNAMLLLAVLLFNSCATLMNSEKVRVKIITNEPSKLLVNGDSINNFETMQYVTISRGKKPISITAYNDSNAKTIQVKSRNSIAYWLNYYPSVHLWTGLLIDKHNPKRYDYPKMIYIDFEDTISNYLKYIPAKTNYKYKHTIKTRPTKVFPVINPGFELSYELKTNHSFSTEASFIYILPTYVLGIGEPFKPNYKGFGFSLEEKYYFNHNALDGGYFGLEGSYLKSHYNTTAYFRTPQKKDSIYEKYNDYLDTIRINRQVFDINLKLGYQVTFKRFVFDFYFGLGLRHRNVQHANKFNVNDVLVQPRHPNIFYAFTKVGEYWTLSFPFSL
jgi:hypothetical protein